MIYQQMLLPQKVKITSLFRAPTVIQEVEKNYLHTEFFTSI